MSSSLSRIGSIGTAVPPVRIEQSQAIALTQLHYGKILKPRSLEILRQVLAHPSIKTRYIAVNSLPEIVLLKDENPDKRMERFNKWAVKLSTNAAKNALTKAGASPADVKALFVNTCTGYLCPGISTYLIEPLGLSPDTKVYDLVGAGCGGALPSIQLAQNMIASGTDGVILCIAVEICTATYQMGDDISLLISNAIFGDGAAATVVWNRDKGIQITDTASRFAPQFRDDVRYYYKNGQLHNRISSSLPKITGELATEFIKKLLEKNNLSVNDISQWAIHPGGDKILNAIQKQLGLKDSDMTISRQILSEYGNMSSPSVMFELERILHNGLLPGQLCLAVAFGAGMSIHGFLLKG